VAVAMAAAAEWDGARQTPGPSCLRQVVAAARVALVAMERVTSALCPGVRSAHAARSNAA
jgi:hypothetical protein